MDRSAGGGDGSPRESVAPTASELDAVLRALPDLYFLLDGERRFVDYSAGRSSDLYRPPEEFLGQRFEAVLPPNVASGMNEAIDRAHATNEVTTYDYTLEMEGELSWFEVRFAPFGEDMTVALVRNVTERRRAAEELQLREERLRQAEKLEALGRVAGGIAHDFNNLLTVISTSCSLAERRLPEDHPARSPLLDARAALRSAGELTRHLLAFARRQSTGTDVLDIDEVVDGMEFILRGLASTPVVFTRERAQTPLRVRAARAQLEQVFLNLVVNAVDAMPQGGELTLRTFADPTGAFAAIEVVDTGVGMTEEVAQRATEPFFTTKPDGKGSGLGLATVDGVARSAGGTVTIESQPNRGTKVVVTLPLIG
jgi:signal transduction histidine kinase